jgi:hypothetical protein
LALENGQPLDSVLEEFGRLPAKLFEEVGADLMPLDCVLLIDGDADERR